MKVFNQLKYLAFVILWIFVFPQGANATHIIGGDLTYRCLGNNNFEITLTVFRDCYNGNPWFDDPTYIAVYNSGWTLEQTLQIPFITDDTISISLNNPCLVVPPNVCVHRSTFRDTISLPFIVGGYTIVYQRCCRNQLIQNISLPLENGASFVANINETSLMQCNSSAVFNQWPPVAICINAPIDFDHSATDPDGDSLVYSLCTPLVGASPGAPQPIPANPGPYAPVIWIGQYSLANVLGGDPLTIHPSTGFLTGVPNKLGNFVVGICVDEYRNGVLISTTKRDFQYNVADCDKPFAAFIAPSVICDGLGVKFENESLNGLNYSWIFDWDNLSVGTSTLEEPFFTYPDTGYYSPAMILNPGTVCADTAFGEVYLTNGYVSATFIPDFTDCTNDTLTIQTVNQSNDAVYGISGYKWTLRNNFGVVVGVNIQENPIFEVDKTKDYTLELVATGNNGCPDSTILNIPSVTHLLDDLQREYAICKGDTLPLFPNADTNLTYEWSPTTHLIGSNTVPNPDAAPPADITYYVEVFGGANPCPADGIVEVMVTDIGSYHATVTPDTIIIGNTAQLEVPYASGVIYSWMASNGTLSASNIYNPVAAPVADSAIYIVTSKLGDCTFTDTVTLRVLTPICDLSTVYFPTGFSPNGDTENDELRLEGNFISEAYWAIYDRWGEKIFETYDKYEGWDGTFHGKQLSPDVYGFILRVTCLGGNTLTHQGNVTLLR